MTVFSATVCVHFRRPEQLVADPLCANEAGESDEQCLCLLATTPPHLCPSDIDTKPQAPNSHPVTMCSVATMFRDIEQPGLYWKSGLFGARPTWTKEPSIDKITELARKHLELPQDELVDIKAFAEGAFNKLYKITCSKGQFIFRVTLPVAPEVKTSSEVATLSFLREKTNIPAPKMIGHNKDFEDDLEFEWIRMERIPGRPLRKVGSDMSWLHKELLVHQIVDFMVQLYHLKLSGIGSLYPDESLSNGDRNTD